MLKVIGAIKNLFAPVPAPAPTPAPVIDNRVLVLCTRGQSWGLSQLHLNGVAEEQGVKDADLVFCCDQDNLSSAIAGDHPSLAPGLPCLILATGNIDDSSTVKVVGLLDTSLISDTIKFVFIDENGRAVA